ncbi:MAG: twin-arginine translocase subunit TatC [Opitutae bacterium]|nr:twin-arginine translocase subunit TatC [Opitutae bacterium]
MIDKTSAVRSRAKKDANEMTFWEHLEELRMTVIWCCAAFVVATLGSLFFYKKIFAVLRRPLEHAIAGMAGSDNVSAAEAALSSMHFMDPFSILLYIALLGGVVISCPFVLFRLGSFVAPALSDSERRKITPVCVVATALFVAGACLAFFCLAPLSIRFMFFFSNEMGLQVNWLAADYYSFIVVLVLFVGVLFEFPLVIVAVQYLEIVSTKTLLSKWRWVIAVILIAIAVVSPVSDPVALLGLTGLLFLLYMSAVFVGDFFLKKKLARRAADEAAFDAEFSHKKAPPTTEAAESTSVAADSHHQPDDSGDSHHQPDSRDGGGDDGGVETAIPPGAGDNSELDSEENGDLRPLD